MALTCLTPAGADKKCVLHIVHSETAVATRLIVSLLKTLQVCIETAISRTRLCQVKDGFTMLSIQPGCEPGHVTQIVVYHL